MDNRARAHLHAISAIILLVGLSSAFLIYRAAQNASPDHAEGVFFNPDYSKQNLRELELYGGRANLLAYEIRQWFLGLWHGKSLAVIVACAAILVSFACFYVADRPP